MQPRASTSADSVRPESGRRLPSDPGKRLEAIRDPITDSTTPSLANNTATDIIYRVLCWPPLPQSIIHDPSDCVVAMQKIANEGLVRTPVVWDSPKAWFFFYKGEAGIIHSSSLYPVPKKDGLFRRHWCCRRCTNFPPGYLGVEPRWCWTGSYGVANEESANQKLEDFVIIVSHPIIPKYYSLRVYTLNILNAAGNGYPR